MKRFSLRKRRPVRRACPVCQREIVLLAKPRPNPKPGDLHVCFGCSSVVAFADDLTLYRPTEIDLHRWPAEQLRRVRDAQAAARMLAKVRAEKAQRRAAL